MNMTNPVSPFFSLLIAQREDSDNLWRYGGAFGIEKTTQVAVFVNQGIAFDSRTQLKEIFECTSMAEIVR